MNTKLGQAKKFIIWPLLFIVIALWNIPHTIAGRYICEALLLITIIISKPDWKLFFSANRYLLVFFAYLFIQLIFFSTNYPLAFSNFRAEWMHFILFTIIGGGVGLIIREQSSNKILLYLGIAFSIPLYIHLILSFIKWISLGVIPWRYWGINETPGDFGYPALVASILFLSFYLYEAKNKPQKILAIFLIGLCITSPFLAASRGGVGFAIVSVLFVFLSYLALDKQIQVSFTKKLMQLLIVVLMVAGVFRVGLIVDPDRWGGIFSRLSVGLQGDPISTYCNGIDFLEQEIRNKGITITPEIQKGLNSVEDGDGQRMMAARSGYDLMSRHPMGIDQSKQAYQIAIVEACKGQPKIFIANAHNGWIDTALAIGIPGALLLIIVMLQYARLGWIALKNTNIASSYGMALFASAIIWLLRGFLDSTLRDQMLEMQAFIFALLLGLILTKTHPLPNKNLVK